MTTADFRLLASSLTKPELLSSGDTLDEKYSHDATPESRQPLAVVMAESEADVIAAVNFCRENGLTVVGRGAGTGLSGGCVPLENSIVISTELMDQFDIDVDRRTAVCGPGVITKSLVDAAAAIGLAYPPDPASYDESTLGGNVAENAGGLRCRRFGVTKDYVLGIRAITADGKTIETGCYNDNRGFALADLLVGSEGTLAIITEITVALIPATARGNTILVAFDNPKDAAQTVSDMNSAGIITTVLEFLDGDAAACSNEYEKNDGLDNVGAILLIETIGEKAAEQTEMIRAICQKNKSSYLRIEKDSDKAELLWNVRRNLSRATKELSAYRISEDVAVPNSKFPTLVDFVAQMNQNSELRINSYGHAGDGNLHVNFLGATGSEAEIAEIERLIDLVLKEAMRLDGTLTGEHGIGLAKKRYLSWEYDSSTLTAMKQVKDSFDSSALLNPDKIFE